MAEENGDNILPAENIELESDDVMENSSPLDKEVSANTVDQEKIYSDIGNEEESDRLAEETTNPVEEENGDLRENGDISENTIEKKSPPEGINSPDVRVRKNGTAIVVGANHKFPVQSRYLRASMGSCHDLCKFGHKHEPEVKTRKPMLGTIREARPLTRTISDDVAKSLLDKQTKKKALSRRLSLPGTIVEKGPQTPTEDVKRSKKEVNQSKLKRIQSIPTPGHSSSRGKTVIQAEKNAVIRSSGLPESSTQRVKEIKTRKEVGSHSKGEKEKAKEPMSMSPSSKTPLKRSPSLKARLYKNLKSFSRSKNQSDYSEEAKIIEPGDVPEKTLYMIEPNTDKKPAKKAAKTSLRRENSPNTPRGSLRKTKGSNGNLKGSQEHEEHPEIGKITEDRGSKSNTPRAKSTGDLKMKAKKTGTNRPEEKDSSAWMVKFRRGTVVALQVANNSPKKLRFKRGKNQGEDQNPKYEGDRRLKNKEDIGKEPHDSTPEAEKVRLRHQEASEKKDTLDLNDVIEETASKLVKTRKSKVKALVGAFETVLSLGDRKRLVETSAS